MEVTPTASQAITELVVLLTSVLAELPWPNMLVAFGIGFGLIYAWFSLLESLKFLFESKLWLTIFIVLIVLSLITDADTLAVEGARIALHIGNILTRVFAAVARSLMVFSSYPLDVWTIVSALIGGRRAYKQKNPPKKEGPANGGRRKIDK
jgi:hypothetical protein